MTTNLSIHEYIVLHCEIVIKYCCYCFTARNISVTLSALDPQQVGQMLIFDCGNVNVPTTENFIVGEALILRCMVDTTTFIDSLLNFTFIWSSNNTVLRIVNQIGQRQDHYVISQLNTSNDGQEYMCEMIINNIFPERINSTIELPLTGKPFINFTACTFAVQCRCHGFVLCVHAIKRNCLDYPNKGLRE